ncbi:MAG: peptidase MA family metallohydrolase [Anaerolineae bacterium]
MTKPGNTHRPFRLRRLTATLIMVLLALRGATMGLAQEVSEPRVEHTYAFAQHISLNLTLPSEVEADTVTLFLRAGGSATEAYMLAVEGGQALYQRDLRARPLPPFTEVTYWWQYPQGDGTEQTTSVTTFLYEDNRFAWESLTSPEAPLSLHWVAGSPELMMVGLDVARTALEEIHTHLGAPEDMEVQIYVYPSMPDLQQALRLSGQAWVGGEAHPEVGVALVAIPPTDQAASQMKALLPHEITHLVLYRRLGAEGYTNVPTWLNEGLAIYFEQRPDPAYALALEEAQQRNRWIALETLCTPFYTLSAEQVTLAYAESQSVTRYLVETYGWSSVRDLLGTYADSLSCSRGVEQALGFDLPTLEREWKVWLAQDGQVAPSRERAWTVVLLTLRDLAPWLLLTLLLLAPGLLMTLTPPSSARSS